MADSGDAAALRAAAGALGVTLPDGAVQGIRRHLALLEVWNRRIHLTGERDAGTLLHKHSVDSLAPALMLPPRGLVIDVGSGAGFPGIILACVRPDLDVVLLEARRRPCSFLAEAIRSIPLPRARVLESRAEDAVAELGGRAQAVTSRALRLDVFLPLAAPLLAPGGAVIAMQTPKVQADASDGLARAVGLRLAEIRDYALPAGEPRRLLRFVQD